MAKMGGCNKIEIYSIDIQLITLGIYIIYYIYIMILQVLL